MTRPFLFLLVGLLPAAALAEVTPGEILIAEMNCAACHAADGPVKERLASRESPRLGAAGAKLDPGWVQDFLTDPQRVQPGTLMPDLLHALPPDEKAQSAAALAHFLASLEGTPAIPAVAATSAEIGEGERLYHAVGCVMCHAPRRLPPSKEGDGDAMAELERLGQTSVPLGAGLARKYSLVHLAEFLRQPLQFRPSGRMPDLGLSEHEARVIAAYLLSDGNRAEREGTFEIDPALVARGKQLFADLNCAACHQVLPDGSAPAPRPARKLDELRARQPRGCLGNKPAANVPRFEMSDRQRQVILALLQEQTPLQIPLTAEQEIRRGMTTLNCYACHHRDRRGGAQGLRREYLTSTLPQVGDEGRVPPGLTGAGAKLKHTWLETVLAEGSKDRPYMATRMPGFGRGNTARLVARLAEADALSMADARPEPPETPGLHQAGRALLGAKGLACTSCHRMGDEASLGMDGIDLASTTRRLQWPWFRSFLLDPQKVRSNTGMPSFWPGGKATKRDILDGDTDKQIAALWLALDRAKAPR